MGHLCLDAICGHSVGHDSHLIACGSAKGRCFVGADDDFDEAGDRGSSIKIGKKIAPNAIFRVVSCLYILYDLTYQFGSKIPPTALVMRLNVVSPC